jgi:nucleotide-binding universal stress UspA family protein
MKYLVPVDASDASLAPVEHLERARRGGEKVEAIVLNVQPAFPRAIARFTRKADRDSLRAERSRAAMARAIERLSRAGIPFRALAAVGDIAGRIAEVAEAERVDQIVMGVGRHAQWLRRLNPSIAQAVGALTDVPVVAMARGKESLVERYLLPAGVAGLAALLLAAE